jgi:AraC-like DNA-binding protein
MGHMVRATTLWGYGELVQQLGGDPELFRTRFHVPRGVENEEDTFISVDAYARMLEASAEDLQCPDFGLRLSRWQGLEIFGPVAVIARNAQTMLSGLEMIGRYLYVHSPALKLTIASEGPQADLRFTYEVSEPGLENPVQGYELSMAIVARIIRMLGGPDAQASAVCFMHPQQGADTAYQQALNCPVHFQQTWCGFEITRSLADRQIESADPETRRIAAKYLDSNYLPRSTALSERVVELVRRLLPTGQCSVDTVAGQLAMHPRSLQRRLADEGVRCQDLIDIQRRALAAVYLAEPELPFSQIAGLLGYAEQSVLNRSCRRWFGMTPRQYRADVTAHFRSRNSD